MPHMRLHTYGHTTSVVSVFKEDIGLKMQKIPYFEAAVPIYAK
jgi:hypothetical protein